LIHCSLAHHETLMPLAAKLAPAHDVFFDLPGHGRSAPWAGTDYHSMQRQSRQHFAWSDAHYRPFVWRYVVFVVGS
jgi:pimeloyl-ACP methyl ester carboxylesterase